MERYQVSQPPSYERMSDLLICLEDVGNAQLVSQELDICYVPPLACGQVT